MGEFPLADFTSIYAIGNGVLTVDYSNGNFGMPVNYAGGTAANSSIVIADSAAPTSVVYNATGADAGNFVVNGNASSEVLFTNVQSASDNASETTLTINGDPNNLINGTLGDTFTAAGADTTATFTNSLPSLSFASPTGTLIVNGHAAADDITFTSVGAGFDSALTVQGDGGGDTVTLDANLSLGSATASGDVAITAANIDLDADIDAGAGSTPGSITLTGAVTLTGSSELQFGGANGLVINGGPVSVGANNLELAEFAAADTADIGVQISGSGGSLTKAGPGTVTLGFADTYTGATTISAGTLADGIANALPTGTALSDSGTLDLAGFSQQVAGITGSGIVTDSGTAATFTVDNLVIDAFAGSLQGSLAFDKSGAGTLALQGSSTNSGAASVSTGTLQVDGQLTCTVNVSGGTLDGDGKVGSVAVTSGGGLSPGDDAPGESSPSTAI